MESPTVYESDYPTLVRIFDILNRVISIFRSSALLLDECDVLLHPLKSELNFPIGTIAELAQKEWRVGIASPLINSLIDSRSDQMENSVNRGFELHLLGGNPHLVLCSEYFYRQELIKPLSRELGSWFVDEMFSRSIGLVFCPISRLSATSSFGNKYGIQNVLIEDGSMFWCSKENPGLESLSFNVDKKAKGDRIAVSIATSHA